MIYCQLPCKVPAANIKLKRYTEIVGALPCPRVDLQRLKVRREFGQW